MAEPRDLDDRSDSVDVGRPQAGEPLSPWVLVVSGPVPAFFGAVLAFGADSAVLGWILIAVGAVLVTMGLVALAVMHGIRRQRWLDGRGTSGGNGPVWSGGGPQG